MIVDKKQVGATQIGTNKLNADLRINGMGKTAHFLTGLIFLSLFSVSCSTQNGGSSSSTSQGGMSNNSEVVNDSNLTQMKSQKVYVEEALIDDIKVNQASCPLSADGVQKICIKICHVPPGNPSAAKEKILPLEAIKAHLNHGSQHAEERDYLGADRKSVV